MMISPVYNGNFFTDKKLMKEIKKNRVRKTTKRSVVKTTLNEDNITKFINNGLNFYK